MEEYLFTTHYKSGDELYYADVNESLIRKLKLRTVEDTYVVGVVAKADVVFIGRDKKNWLFKNLLDAKRSLESIGVNAEIEIIRRESGDKNS